MRGLVRSEIKVVESDYYQGFDEKKLLQIAENSGTRISMLYNESTYLIKGTVFMIVYGETELTRDDIKKLLSAINFYKGQPIEINADYGFRQLAEVAIKALSPGINDPATAVLALHSLADLFSFRMHHHPSSLVQMDNKYSGIYIPHSSFTDLFEKCIYPIWHYGKEDQYIQNALLDMLEQLKGSDNKKLHSDLFDEMINKINKAKS